MISDSIWTESHSLNAVSASHCSGPNWVDIARGRHVAQRLSSHVENVARQCRRAAAGADVGRRRVILDDRHRQMLIDVARHPNTLGADGPRWNAVSFLPTDCDGRRARYVLGWAFQVCSDPGPCRYFGSSRPVRPRSLSPCRRRRPRLPGDAEMSATECACETSESPVVKGSRPRHICSRCHPIFDHTSNYSENQPRYSEQHVWASTHFWRP
jgi:hypothetical protein